MMMFKGIIISCVIVTLSMASSERNKIDIENLTKKPVQKTSTFKSSSSMTMKVPLTAIYDKITERESAIDKQKNISRYFDEIDHVLYSSVKNGIIQDWHSFNELFSPVFQCTNYKSGGKNYITGKVNKPISSLQITIFGGRFGDITGCDLVATARSRFYSDAEIQLLKDDGWRSAPVIHGEITGTLLKSDTNYESDSYHMEVIKQGKMILDEKKSSIQFNGSKMGATKFDYLYSGVFNGISHYEDGSVKVSGVDEHGQKIALTTKPHSLYITDNEHIITSYSPNSYTYTAGPVNVTLTADNYVEIWSIQGAIQTDTLTCQALEAAKSLQVNETMSIGELKLAFKDAMLKNYKNCTSDNKYKPNIGAIMYDKNRNIVFNKSIEFQVMNNEFVSKNFSKLFSDLRTEKFARKVESMAQQEEKWGLVNQADAMRSLAVKAASSKNFDAIQVAVLKTTNSSDMLKALKQ